MERPHGAITLTVNGTAHQVDVEHRATLLEVLRAHLGLTGAKEACNRGECGACVVLVDELPMNACHLLAHQVAGRDIVTIEGLVARKDFEPLLEAFVAHDAGQCGFCTPGFAVGAYAALKQHPDAPDWLLPWELVGHICRCNAYDGLLAAVRAARDARRQL